jgi:dihydropteroate synthase
MIWARPLDPDGEAEAVPMLARAGLSPAERALVFEGLHRVALVTGLEPATREVLADVVGEAWLGGGADTALVRWSRASVEQWRRRLMAESPWLLIAFERLAMLDAPLAPFTVGPKTFDFNQGPAVMGVVNVTPDSFSDGGRYTTVDAAVAHAELLVAAGAELLDIGGESTRPGAPEVSEEEELRRVVAVIAALHGKLPGIPISVDTSKAVVARAAVEAGARLVNDVTGLRDEALLQAVVELGVPVCVMHMRGTPRTMQVAPVYDDVVAEVLTELETTLRRAESGGLPRSRVLVDPGIGFGKTLDHNLFLLRRLGDLRLLGAPVLVGTSRKSFLGLLTGRPADARAVASAASVAVLRGASVVRVHDVPQTRDALAVGNAIRTARAGGLRFST